jgi:hypothetical protein
VDAALHAELGGSEGDGLLDPRREVALGDFIGIRRPLSLAEPAEGAADHADVGEVDVAVDDEGHRVARQLGPQLIRSNPHLLDHLRPRLGEERGQLVLGEWLSLATFRYRPRGKIGSDDLLGPATGPSVRNEAPVFELDHVQDPLLHPLGVHVLRVDAQPLGQRIPTRRQLLPHLVRRRERLLGRDVVSIGAQAAKVGGSRFDQIGPPVGQIRRDLHPHVRHQPSALLDQALDLVDGDRIRPGWEGRRGLLLQTHLAMARC